MANALYPKGKEGILSDLDLLSGDIRVALIDTGAVSYNAAHDFLDDVSAGIVARSAALSGKSVTAGVFDADDPTIAGVSGATVEALVLYEYNASDAAARLIGWIDSPAISFAPNGSGVIVTWDAAGIIEI